MIIRLTNIGEGTEESPNRVDLPSSVTVEMSQDGSAMYVDVVRHWVPPQLPRQGAPHWITVMGRPILISLPEDMLALWWQRLARLHPDRQPPYMPSFV